MAFRMKGMKFGNEGPIKPNNMMEAKKKPIDRYQADEAMDPHPDSDAHVSAVPTFSDQVSTANIDMRNKKAATPKKGKCNCYDGYSRVKGTAPCAPGSCKKSNNG